MKHIGNYHSLPRNMSSVGSTRDKWQRRSNSRASSVTGKKSASLPERKSTFMIFCLQLELRFTNCIKLTLIIDFDS